MCFLSLPFGIRQPLQSADLASIGTSLNPNSSAFLLVQGTFDGFCAGLLIYIGYNLLIVVQGPSRLPPEIGLP